MDRRIEASEIMQRAEQEVRSLLLRVVSEGDYDLATILMDCARQLSTLSRGIVESSSVRGESLQIGSAQPSDADSRAASEVIRRDGLAADRRRRKSAKSVKAGYPRFYRERDELVKIGWSKKRRAEYRHKAPWSIVQKVVQVIEEKGSRGTMFLLDDLLPVTNQDGSEIPSYQVYLVFAWLKQEHLIIQHGRRGYTVGPSLDLVNQAQKHWAKLSREQ